MGYFVQKKVMRSIFTVALFVSISTFVFPWGMTGHRVIGEVAENNLTDKAKLKVKSILKGRSLAEVSNWMDNIKSDRSYDSLRNWHWVTIPDGETYETSKKEPKGDAVAGIEHVIKGLKSGELDKKKEEEYLKILVHLVGDLHQPLHVGNGTDRGGNEVKVEWFWRSSNLHRVWDSEMIDGKKYSYTELAKIVDNPYNKLTSFNELKSLDVREWANEAMQYRKQIYDLPADRKLSYEYQYKNWDTVKGQLFKAGIRLANVLNDIYG